MDNRYTALDIANFYIQLANSIPEDSIDNLKLNKILYFAQGRFLSVTGRPLFSDDIEAWDYGPVIPSVYHTFKACGKNPIAEPQSIFDESRLSSEELDILVDVYMNYSKYTGLALKEMTHQKGTPWDKIYEKGENKKISPELMKTYFDADDSFKAFDIDDTAMNVISSVPAYWDSPEDDIYDTAD